MADPTRINPYIDEGDLRDRLDGAEFNSAGGKKGELLCDFCSAGVAYAENEQLFYYLADKVLGNGKREQRINSERPLITLATYCEDCGQQLLLFPCEGFAEVRVEFELTPDGVMKNISISDISTRSEGIPWDPVDLAAKIADYDTDISPVDVVNKLGTTDDLWGPENMVTYFMSITDTDIRDVVDWEGNINPKLLGKIRKEFRQHAKEYHRKGGDRQAYRETAGFEK